MSMSLESPPIPPTLESDSGLARVVLAPTAHELRLPIRHIKGFVTSLRRLDVDWDEETRRDFLSETELETDRLADLVEAWFTNVEHGSVS
jgi:signal transduction histidine kinase